jgi:hypothetical protein
MFIAKKMLLLRQAAPTIWCYICGTKVRNFCLFFAKNFGSKKKCCTFAAEFDFAADTFRGTRQLLEHRQVW